MKDPIIYSIKDLQTKVFDDEEIDIVSKSLIYSLIIGMFRHIKNNLTDKEIITICTKQDNWYDNYYWTELQKTKFQKILNDIFYNLYRFGPIKCNNSSEEFIIKYGFNIKKPKNKNRNKNILKNKK